MAGNKNYKVGGMLKGIAQAIKANKDDPAKLEQLADQLTTISGASVSTNGIALSEVQAQTLIDQGIALSE